MKTRPSGLFLTAILIAVAAAVTPRPAAAGAGGPDAYGYTWIDSDEAGGPTYDASYQPPAAILGLCEQEWYTVSIGFDFEFYGALYTRAAISANGVLYLTNSSLDTSMGGDNTNACPASAVQNPRIAVLWDDYFANNDYILCGGSSWWITSVFGYSTVGAAPDRTFVASWINNPHRTCGGSGGTFTVKLSESSGAVEVHYQDTTLGSGSCDDGASATVGISDSSYATGSILEVGCDTSGLAEAGYAVRFDPPTTCGDADGDGYTDAACGGDDCDDGAYFVNPGAAEVAYDGVDQDCDGSDRADLDGDGHDWIGALGGGDDCDDGDAAIHPGAIDSCNGVDDDCDGYVDEGFDLDGDGVSICAQPADCWDLDAGTHPGAVEVADGVDNDCDGTVDEGTEDHDDDGDGYTETGGDCDDGDPSIHPTAGEVWNGVDDDCDGPADEGTEGYDDDGDGYTEIDGDCDDDDGTIHPGAADPVDGVDNDCDGSTDGYGGDADGDGDGFTVEGGDCDDTDATVSPAAVEVENGADDDCDGTVDEGTDVFDDDDDGATELQGDCVDDDPAIHPDAAELANGVDDDCDGIVDEGTEYDDTDGDGFTEAGGDCDDDDAAIHPGAAEQENGADDDCDGVIDEGTAAHDDDLDGSSEIDGDCDDTDPWVGPEADETCDGLDNDCDGELDEGCEADEDDGESGDAPNCAIGGNGRAVGFGVLLLTLLALRTRRGRHGSGLPILIAAMVGSSGCGSDVNISLGVGDLVITPDLVDLGPVAVGGEATTTVYLDNTGDASVTISSISIQDDSSGLFAMAGETSFTIGRGDSQEIELTYTPAAAGLHQVVLSIVSNAGDQREVPVRGQGVNPALQVFPLVLDFGLVAPQDLGQLDLVLQNDGLVPVTVVALEVSGDVFEVELPAAVGEIPFQVAVEQDVSLTVEFAPLEALPYEALLQILSDDPDDPQIAVSLLGNVCQGGETAVQDEDGDGFSACGGDCDDDSASTHPGADEHLDGVDNDCDGDIDEGTAAFDDDGDGYSENDGDCDDTEPTTAPDAEEVFDGVDNDCDGVVDDGTADLDDDGDGYAEIGGDCDDDDPSLHPGAEELADGLDNDCDGTVDEGTDWYDDDGDGFTEAGGDCDDAATAVNPAADEVAGNGVDDDCDGITD